jgi:hypothetical protein
MSEYAWQEQKIRKSWVTLAAQSQGALTTLIGTDYAYLIPKTMWDMDSDMPVIGPASEAEWAALQVLAAGPRFHYIVLGGNLLLSPTPAAGINMQVFYQSSYPVTSDAGVPKAALSADTDLFLIPESIIMKALDVKWKEQKGEPWEKAAGELASLLPKKLMKDTKKVLSLDSCARAPGPGVIIPSGSWAV